MVFAARHLRFNTVTPARPIKVIRAFAEQRAAVRVAFKLEQFRLALHPQGHHRRLRLRGVVVELIPGRDASMHVEIGGGRTVAGVGCGRILPRKTERASGLDPEGLDFGALVEPAERRRTISLQHPRRGVVARRVGVKIEIIFVQRPEITARVGGLPEQLHALVAAGRRVGGDMIRQLHVVTVVLPRVLDDGEVIHPVVFQFTQLPRIAGKRAFAVPPDVEHHPRAEHAEKRRRRMRNIRQHLAHVRRDGDVAGLDERVAITGRSEIVGGFALRTFRGVGLRPIQVTADEDSLDR